eukprot:3767371-Alexandrium_andersonii.AAC.1
MFRHVYFQEEYVKHRRSAKALYELAPDNSRWVRVAQWTAKACAPQGWKGRPRQVSRVNPAALWFGVTGHP